MQKMGMRWFWGLAIILVGVGFLLNSLGISNANTLITNWWPIILVVIGLGEIINGEFLGGLFWILTGIAIGIFTADLIYYNGNIWQIVWPIIVVMIGLRYIFRPLFKPHPIGTDGSYVSTSAAFSGSDKKISSKNFRGSHVNAAFGGVKLDLRDASLAKEGAIIDVAAIFGGVEILVAKNIPVQMEITAIFGGHEDKRDTSKINDKLPTLTIRGEVIFGGVEIKD